MKLETWSNWGQSILIGAKLEGWKVFALGGCFDQLEEPDSGDGVQLFHPLITSFSVLSPLLRIIAVTGPLGDTSFVSTRKYTSLKTFNINKSIRSKNDLFVNNGNININLGQNNFLLLPLIYFKCICKRFHRHLPPYSFIYLHWK